MTDQGSLANLLTENRSFAPDPTFAANAVAQPGIYEEARADRLAFWAKQARNLDWHKPFTQVLDWSNAPFARWFHDGQLNVAYNCLDRHVLEGRGDRVAIHFEGEPGDTKSYTYAQLTAEVKRAANAIAAGFDGVEVHAANGYLIDQFLRSGSNQRSDAYGGSIDNRARFLGEVMQAITAEIGGGRTGIRLSPVTPANDASDDQPQPLFEHVVKQLAPLGLAYVHVIEGSTGGPRDFNQGPAPFDYAALRQAYRSAGGQGAWMVNNGYDLALAQQSLADGADIVAFGRPFIANPDLGARLKAGGPFNTLDRATLYGGGDAGYLDYPALG